MTAVYFEDEIVTKKGRSVLRPFSFAQLLFSVPRI
jgi:hypothetical protein